MANWDERRPGAATWSRRSDDGGRRPLEGAAEWRGDGLLSTERTTEVGSCRLLVGGGAHAIARFCDAALLSQTAARSRAGQAGNWKNVEIFFLCRGWFTLGSNSVVCKHRAASRGVKKLLLGREKLRPNWSESDWNDWHIRNTLRMPLTTIILAGRSILLRQSKPRSLTESVPWWLNTSCNKYACAMHSWFYWRPARKIIPAWNRSAARKNSPAPGLTSSGDGVLLYFPVKTTSTRADQIPLLFLLRARGGNFAVR